MDQFVARKPPNVKDSVGRTTIGNTLDALCWAIEVERFLNDEDCMPGKVLLS